MILNILKSNLKLKLLSFLSALFLWVYVYYKEVPSLELTSIAEFIVPIEFRGLQANYEVISNTDKVVVKIQGNRNLLLKISPSEGHIKAWVDLKDKVAGFYPQLPVKVTSIGKVVSIYPPDIGVTLENLKEKVLPVKYLLTGNLLADYSIKSITIKPPTVKVKARSSLIDKISKVEIELNTSKLMYGGEQIAIPYAKTKAEEKIENKVEIIPSQVAVVIDIIPNTVTKTVPVVPSLINSPALGYKIIALSIEPPVATLKGKYEVLKEINTISTEPVDIGGAKEDVKKSIKLNIPKGTSILNGEEIKILISIKKTFK